MANVRTASGSIVKRARYLPTFTWVNQSVEIDPWTARDVELHRPSALKLSAGRLPITSEASPTGWPPTATTPESDGGRWRLLWVGAYGLRIFQDFPDLPGDDILFSRIKKKSGNN